MLNENQQLRSKLIKEALEHAKIITLGLPDVINEKLEKLNLTLVSDIALIENNPTDVIKNVLLNDEINIIKFKRDRYTRKLGHILNVLLDPENCILGTIDVYYELLLAIENFDHKNCGLEYNKYTVNINALDKNTFNISRLNLILSLFSKRDIEWLILRCCNRMTFKEIGGECNVSSAMCQKKVNFMIRRLHYFYRVFLVENIENIMNNDEYLQSEKCSIYFLGLDEKICNSLARKNINTKEELKNKINSKEVIRVRNIGSKSYELILQCMEM